MLVPEDLAAVPILSGLPPATLAEIARTAADIHVNPGTYVAHEGDPPALFIVLSGLFEITKILSGVETVVTARAPHEIYGEVPVIYGTQFQTSARAANTSRIVRIELLSYYKLAMVSPAFATAVGALALDRMEGLHTLVATPPTPRGALIGDSSDRMVTDLRRFLTRNRVPFESLTSEAAGQQVGPEATDLRAVDLPAFRLTDGVMIVRPTRRALAEAIGLHTVPQRDDYDVVIVGAGPSGLAAAVYGASEGLTTLVVEEEAPGGQAGTSSRIENYLGFPGGVSGDELAARAYRQAERLGAEVVVTRRVMRIRPDSRTIELDGGDPVIARAIILATGVTWRLLKMPGHDRLLGKGVHYGAAYSEAPMTQGQDIHLVGGGNSAGQAAMLFSSHARTVTLVARGQDIGLTMSRYLVDQIRSKANVEVLTNSEVVELRGDARLSALDIVDRGSGKLRQVPTAALFIFIGAEAETDWLPPEIARDDRGYVLTGTDVVQAGRWTLPRDPYLVETSVPGIFACGDVRLSRVKRVAAAVGEGSIAIAFVHQYLASRAGGDLT